jgi:hypothetical protein
VKLLTQVTTYPRSQSSYTLREYFSFIHLVGTVPSLHFTRRFASSPWKLRDQQHHFRPPPQHLQPSLFSPPTSLCRQCAAALLLRSRVKISVFTLRGRLHASRCFVMSLSVPPRSHVRFYSIVGARGSVLVEALCYKPEGRGFETRRGE